MEATVLGFLRCPGPELANFDVTGSDFLCWLSEVPVLTFSGKELSRSSPALDDNIELWEFY